MSFDKANEETDNDEVALQRPAVLVEEVDFGGMSLKEFALSASHAALSQQADARLDNAQPVEECEYV